MDPGSGTAATLEMCRAIGEAVKNGWKRRCTLVYASWDAEEYGLVGSTEWAEEHASTVDQKVALLLNVDSAVSGRELDMGGVPSLRDLALDAAGAINDVRSGRSLREIWVDAQRKAWAAASPLILSDPIWDDAVHPSRATAGNSSGVVSSPRCIRWARARTTRSFSITSGSPPSTLAFRAATACTTPFTTTLPGWRSSAIPSS